MKQIPLDLDTILGVKNLFLVEMRRLLDHMGQIEQPWNCPHGRPTIRHLVNTSLLD